jgi:heme oxygenase (mycobilin-producing)
MSEPSGAALPADATRELRALLAATRELLWISSAEDAQAATARLVEALGGSVVPADQADDAALPVDVSFGHGVPLVPTASGGGTAAALARAVPAFVHDAHRALELAGGTERAAEDADGGGRVPGFVAFSRVEVPVAGSQELVAAFEDRLGAVDAWTGFDRLEVWAAPDDPTSFVMISWWDDETAFRAYMGSDDHRRSHARIPAGPDRPRPAGFEGYRVVTR